MKTAIRFIRADHGPAVRQAIGTLAVLVALTYTLGYLTGQFVHSLNDRLAYGSRDIPTITAPTVLPILASCTDSWLTFCSGAVEHGVLRMIQPATTPAPILTQRQAPAITAPTLPTITAPPLESLTVAQLRQLARAQGHRKLARTGRRAQLLEVLA